MKKSNYTSDGNNDKLHQSWHNTEHVLHFPDTEFKGNTKYSNVKQHINVI